MKITLGLTSGGSLLVTNGCLFLLPGSTLEEGAVPTGDRRKKKDFFDEEEFLLLVSTKI